MRADDVRSLGALAASALGGGVQRVSQAHAGIAERVFDSVSQGLGPAVRAVQDGVSRAA